MQNGLNSQAGAYMIGLLYAIIQILNVYIQWHGKGGHIPWGQPLGRCQNDLNKKKRGGELDQPFAVMYCRVQKGCF